MRFAALVGLVAAVPETPDTFKSSTTTNQASVSAMPACADGESPMNGNLCLPKQTGTFWYDLPGNRTRFDADPPDMSGGVMGSMMGGMMGGGAPSPPGDDGMMGGMMGRRNANREAMLLSDLKDHQSALALKDNSMNAKI